MSQPLSKKSFRADSLDALRGLTIAMMVLCGTICNTVLPPWMSHCQVPPPDFVFNPSIYGITWVDLVFPFFLFAMGAAMPFSVGSRRDRGTRLAVLGVEAIWRGIKLAFFAIFIQNCYPWIVARALGHPTDPQCWGITIGAFLVLFLLFSRFPWKMNAFVRRSIPVLGVIIACAIMGWLESHVTLSDEFMASNPSKFQIFDKHLDAILYKSNIIILLLGNMAAVGTIIYICTIGKPLARLALLPFLMAILLSDNADGSWQQKVFNWTPFPWLYQFVYLKYLFVVIPGTIAGEFLRKWILSGSLESSSSESRRAVSTGMVAFLSFAIIVVNVTLLFGRHLVANFWISSAIAAVTIYFANRLPENRKILSNLVKCAAFALMLGLFWEAYQGGIRKDDPTYSYYFVTSGLAFYCLAMLVIICDIYRWRTLASPFTLAGKNPMVAYVAPSMVIFPLMNLLGIGDSAVPFWESSWILAMGRGIICTAIAIAMAAYLSKIKLYWRT